MSYMVEGGGTTTYSKSKRWLYCHVEESKRLLQRITDIVVRYLVLQVAAGAQVNVFCFVIIYSFIYKKIHGKRSKPQTCCDYI